MTQDLSDLKLTKAQRRLLAETAARDDGWYVVDYYPPAQALVARGLAEWTGRYHDHLRITPAGRATLKALGGSEHER